VMTIVRPARRSRAASRAESTGAQRPRGDAREGHGKKLQQR
jgi:hypothetical protein